MEQDQQQSLKVLLSAYACRPHMGSEPGVGWHTAQQISTHHQVWVLTRADNQPTIEAELAAHPNPNLQIIYCNVPGQPLGQLLGLRSGQQLHYYLWQLAAYQAARKLHQSISFDIAQHITYVKYWSPSFISLLPVPFIWGPVGGGESAPKAFLQGFGAKGQRSEKLRNIARHLAEHGPFVRLTAKHTAIALATTPETAQRLKKIGVSRISQCSQLGLSHSELTALSQRPQSSEPPSRFLSIGRLLHWKGFHLSLRAFAQANLPQPIEYWIIGSGPEQERLQNLAKQLKIEPRVKFLAEMPREDVLKHLSSAIALIHPSLHDSGGFVCLEAMAASLPVICLDLGGPALQITKQTGIKISATTPEQTIPALAQAMAKLSTDLDLGKALGKAGQQRAQAHFSWEQRGHYFSQMYSQLTASSSHPPTVAIFSGRLLPASETFIRAQAEGLTRFKPVYVGARRVTGLDLPEDRTLVVNQGGIVGKGQEYLFKRFGHAPQLIRQVRQLQPGLVHAHFGVCGALALPVAKALQKPLVVTFHGFDACMTDDYAKKNSLSTRIYLQRREQLKQSADTFIAVSNFIKGKLVDQGFPEDKIKVHYIGVDTQKFNPDANLIRQPVVLFVGRLTEKKGCEYLIKAMAKVQAIVPNAQLVAIGDGPLRDTLEAKAAETLSQYQFLGVQSPDQVRQWMNKAYVLVAPSVTTHTGDSEGLPMVILEAQAMGLPVISSYHAGIPEAVVHEKTGYLTQEKDWQSIASYMLQLFQNHQLWQQVSHAGQKQVQTKFDLHHQIETLENIYSSVIHHAHSEHS